jgi:hypothetical protein
MDGILIAASEAITPGSNARGDSFQEERRPLRYFGNEIAPFRDLTHGVPLKLFTEIELAHIQ